MHLSTPFMTWHLEYRPSARGQKMECVVWNTRRDRSMVCLGNRISALKPTTTNGEGASKYTSVPHKRPRPFPSAFVFFFNLLFTHSVEPMHLMKSRQIHHELIGKKDWAFLMSILRTRGSILPPPHTPSWDGTWISMVTSLWLSELGGEEGTGTYQHLLGYGAPCQ